MQKKNTLDRFLTKLILFVLAITLVGPLEMQFSEPVEPVVAEFQQGRIRASTIHTNEDLSLEPRLTAQAEGSVASYEDSSTFLSSVFYADFSFDAVEMKWEEHRPPQAVLEIFVRFEYEEGGWSSWFDIEDSIDYKDGTEDDIKEASTIVPTRRSNGIQYKVVMNTYDETVTPRVQNMQFHYIDASVEVAEDLEDTGSIVKESTQTSEPIQTPTAARLEFANSKVDVISREEWGVDQSLGLLPPTKAGEEEVEIEAEEDHEPTFQELYPEEFELLWTDYKDDDGNLYVWPRSAAANIDKIIIHHTAGELTEDPAATMRAIYYYHTVSRGWGDIGYNYVVADGQVFEGRAGGERVVGGHAAGYNTGSIGIAVVGNFEEVEVPFEDIEALGNLIAEKAARYNIDVDGFSSFRGEFSANLEGHRDVGSTACPGENLYALLPVLRNLISNGMVDYESDLLGQTSDEDFAFVSVGAYSSLVFNPQETASFDFKLKNIGQKTWNSDTYLLANQNTSAEALVHLVKDEENAYSIAYMQEDSVAPGETATFTVYAESMIRGGFESFDVTPMFNGEKKTRHYLDLPVYVYSPQLTYDLVDIQVDESRVESGEEINVEVEILNTGNVVWSNSGDFPMSLATAEPYDRKSYFLTGDANRYAELDQESVAPGETGTFTFELTAPELGSYYTEYMVPIIEGIDWLEGGTLKFEIIVFNPNAQATLVDMSDDTTFEPGEKKKVWMQLENIGTYTWKDENFSVGKLKNASIGMTTPKLEESEVDSYEVGEVTFTVTAPDKPGNYSIFLFPRYNGQNLMKARIRFDFVVEEGSNDNTGSSTNSEELDQEDVRLKLSYDTAEDGNPVITADGRFEVLLGNSVFLEAEAGEEIEVREMDDYYQLVQNGYAWVVEEEPRFVGVHDGTIFEIVSYENRPSWNQDLNDNLFRGILEVREDDGDLIVINELPMDMYLRGVAESIESEPTEKKNVMSIISRTYMRFYLENEKFPGKPYNGSDDPDEFQKYLGYGYELRAPEWVEAVETTSGLVVTYKGELVKTPYFSATDGTSTKSAEEVWGWTNTPYLIPVADPLCESSSFSGHGVGLSGCGATAAAESGYGYEEIIKYYYTGVEIELK